MASVTLRLPNLTQGELEWVSLVMWDNSNEEVELENEVEFYETMEEAEEHIRKCKRKGENLVYVCRVVRQG